ncbi:MAG: cytidine deaminase [Lachnospiraceae bacterium]|nr:cytidine deaminase [Lachnospiraceae bacterium]
MDYSELGRLADKARENSYCIYSGFSVGAALLTAGGRVYTGCNIENASYPAGICAERTAFSKAISEGERRFTAIAISGGSKGEAPQDAYPCGICRQFMNEFVNGNEFDVIVVHSDLSHTVHKLKELLPYSFGPDNLNK